MRVGDFVRFKSTIIRNNKQLALSSDRGLVVATNDTGSRVRVRWEDGGISQHRSLDLTRVPGDMGKAVRSHDKRESALDDRGSVSHRPRKPMPLKGTGVVPAFHDWERQTRWNRHTGQFVGK